MNFHPRSPRRLTPLLLVLAALITGCGSTRPPQSEESLVQRRDQARQIYLDTTKDRYTAILKRTKDHLDAYKAGQRPNPPVIDYLVISGGGDIGAFGAGFLKGWASVPKTDPLARPRFA